MILGMKTLKLNAVGVSILHVEDNDALRKQASHFFKKIFDTTYAAMDGKEGLVVFKKYKPSIVILDIEMPNMNGIELAENIKKIAPQTKIIIMSTFDGKEYLYQAIEIGVFRFLEKPASLQVLMQVLFEAITTIKEEENTRFLDIHIRNIFNHQSSMVLMMSRGKPILANQTLLNFFGVKDIAEGVEKYGDFGSLFLEHEGFLYNQVDRNWFEEINENSHKLYQIKLIDKNKNLRHFILKYQAILEKNGYGVLSFDDITELNLLNLSDEKHSKHDEQLQDTHLLFRLLATAQRSSTKIHLFNYYKGLCVTNDAIIIDIINNETVVLKTNYQQQKTILIEKRSYIVSDILPYVIRCDKLEKIDFKQKTVEFTNLHFVATSPITRDTVRVIPDENYTISLFIEEKKFHGNIIIQDISINAVKLEFNDLPVKLKEGSEVFLDIVLNIAKQNIIVNTKATMLRKDEKEHSVSIVFIFKFEANKKSDLVKYITHRQMEIIREFKRLLL